MAKKILESSTTSEEDENEWKSEKWSDKNGKIDDNGNGGDK